MKAAPLQSQAQLCDLCRVSLAEEHQHLIDASTQQIECACDACAILFSGDNQKFRRVPRGVRFLPNFRLSDEHWNSLMIPIGVAFLYKSTRRNRAVALYPSPAGPVESLLTLDTWSKIERNNPELETLSTDVEGLLVYRVGSAREHYRIPIDECFKLCGIIRTKWRGLSGGSAAWLSVAQFLDHLKRRSA